MSVPLSRFWSELTTILSEITTARYVAIDLEMTGIEPRNAPPLQRPTMDQLYKRAKEATETFNVLQLGLTCISYEKATDTARDDGKSGVFHLRSYNFNVSPMFDTRSSGGAVLTRVLDRTLTLSYKTLLFLSKNRIRIEDAYDGGIPYLSRAEESQVVAEILGSKQLSEAELVDIEELQQETKQFCADVTNTIRAWASDPSSRCYLNISNPHDGPMTRFQRRLVYQILDTHFDRKYHAVVKENYFMQVSKRDDEAELKTNGLTSLVKLVGGSFADDVYKTYALDADSIDSSVKSKLEQCEAELQVETPILVGHNMFLDLCFLYATFFGPLPDTLEEFGHTIHELFPRILDTKHVLTHADHEMAAPKNLDDVFLELEAKNLPFAIEHRQSRYTSTMHPVNVHQAGHDSYKTSVVLLKELCKYIEGQNTASQEALGSKTAFEWESPAVQKFANKVRIGNAGLWELGGGRDFPKSSAT
ncbi:hypothetical protein SEPCBS119000_000462 [Sporothrix epigloea]|uniref:Uncharacterized protein n=1 Tax=Sporothrix epigloea TaxID=1892477 RepID=A0ABP0D911_9PEZI